MKALILTLLSITFLFSCNKEEVSVLKSLNTLEGKWAIEQVDLSKLSKTLINLKNSTGTFGAIYPVTVESEIMR